VIAVRLNDPLATREMASRLLNQIAKIEVADIKKAYESLPGYGAQQSTLNTQQAFTLLIGVLVIGGFFQIQMLQKVAQIGMLKAIGASSFTVAAAALAQIVGVAVLGVGVGAVLTYLFSLTFPPTLPIVFRGDSVAIALISLLSIGPVGGLVSVRYALRIEPLKALGLAT
jgi:putative ABC transport system permease protein